jgi:hypothetical protein
MARSAIIYVTTNIGHRHASQLRAPEQKPAHLEPEPDGRLGLGAWQGRCGTRTGAVWARFQSLELLRERDGAGPREQNAGGQRVTGTATWRLVGLRRTRAGETPRPTWISAHAADRRVPRRRRSERISDRQDFICSNIGACWTQNEGGRSTRIFRWRTGADACRHLFSRPLGRGRLARRVNGLDKGGEGRAGRQRRRRQSW